MKHNIKILIICLIFIKINNAFSIENFENLLLLNDFKTTSLMKASADNNTKAIDILLRNDYNIDAQNLANVSVLHYAVKNNSKDAVQLLINNKVNLNIQDDEGFTPLMRACLNENFAIVQILIDNGAYLWTKNNFEESALFLALVSDCNQCAQYILEEDYKRNKKLDSIKTTELNKSIKVAIKKENKEMYSLLTNYLKTQTTTIANIDDENNKINNTQGLQTGLKNNELRFIFNGRIINETEFKQIQEEYKEILNLFKK